MINKNELRIGNIVRYSNQFGYFYGRIVIIGHEYCNLDTDGSQFYYTGLNPVPLTEEWLLKFGFEDGNTYINTKDQWEKNKFGLIKCIWEENESTFHLCKTPNGELEYYKHGKVPIIEYVHQLQNLYFALTGEELELK